MVAPNAAGASFDVFLQFSLDEAANKRVQQRVTTIQQELKRIQDQAKKSGQAVNEAMEGVDKKAQAAQKSVVMVGAAVAQLGSRVKQTSSEVNKSVDSNIKKYKQLEEAAKRVRQQAGLISGAAARGAALFGGLFASGAAVVGGGLLEANRLAKELDLAGKNTQATREWAKATEDLAKARSRVDTVLLREALPLLKQAAGIANQIATFIEAHPEIVQAALKTGLVVAGLGAVGLAVSKGIKLVADIAYITAVATELIAAKLHKKAAEQNLAAAATMKITNRADDLRRSLGQTPTAAGGKIGNAVTTIALTASAVYIAFESVDFVLEKLGQPKLGAMFEAELNFLKGLPDVFSGKIKLNELALQEVKAAEATVKLKDATEELAEVAGPTASELEKLKEQQDSIVDAFTRWKEDDAQLISEAAENRKNIIADAEKAIANATRQYNQQRVDINKRFEATRANLIDNFAKDLQQAEENYAKSRAQIIEDAGIEIQRIEEEHQENIRKMTLEHDERVESLTASRDALGLAKEARKFQQDLSESERETNREIAQRRQDTARRLQELAVEFAAERAQRQVQFQEALRENEEQKKEELKLAAIAHAEELKQIRAQRATQLRELQETLNAERQRRRDVFIAEIRDLDATLLGERNLKVRYYNLMLQDAEQWLAAYRAKLASAGKAGTTAPTLDSGGYAQRGLYRMAWDGQREFVMSGATTRAAERIIGGQLNQDVLERALSAIGSGRQATYVDQRRLERPMSKAERDQYKRMAMDALGEVLNG